VYRVGGHDGASTEAELLFHIRPGAGAKHVRGAAVELKHAVRDEVVAVRARNVDAAGLATDHSGGQPFNASGMTKSMRVELGVFRFGKEIVEDRAPSIRLRVKIFGFADQKIESAGPESGNLSNSALR